MGDTNIEWANKVWNPIAGCTIVSPGCTNCYAMKMAHRIEGMNKALGRENHYAGLTKKTKAGAVWTGKIAAAPDSIFLAPLRWRKPARVFVNSMADLGHEDVADAILDRAYAVMALCPHLTFMVLTKRSARMRAYLSAPDVAKRVWAAANELAGDNERTYLAALAAAGGDWGGATPWPLPNVWAGASVEDQPRADERIPDLLATPAAVRFLSCEPLLGPLDLEPFLCPFCDGARWVNDENWEPEHPTLAAPARIPRDGMIACAHCNLGGGADFTPAVGRINWVIAGGESGPNARPSHPDWFRLLRDQCQAAGVPFFFKQWGEFEEVGAAGSQTAKERVADGDHRRLVMVDTLGRSVDLHSDDREWLMERVGKKAAGAKLDGREHREFPT